MSDNGPESITTIPILEGEIIESAFLETDGFNGWLRLQSAGGFDIRIRADYCSLSEHALFAQLEGQCVSIEYTPDDPDDATEPSPVSAVAEEEEQGA
jgi:hypothetical protein